MSDYSYQMKKLIIDNISKPSKDLEDKIREISKRYPALKMPEAQEVIDAVKKYSEAISKRIDDLSR